LAEATIGQAVARLAKRTREVCAMHALLLDLLESETSA
jgi:hypothetical protein